ncbi:cyanide hydratase [Alternaria panax]|uniref:nitrilase n=1 Tax=Alternaria panax TaxID=48097 RepID=A0AAD4IAM7_9PLEO|nr:cyanide hydratase [Alternaria panax]
MDVELGTKYMKNSLSYGSPEIARICAAARTARIAVVLGFSENDHNSLYIAQCIINTSGTIVMKRRKIKPTHMERTVYGDGDGTSLNNVVEVEGVGRVGGLNCWEHMQPLLKYHTNSQHEEIHVAAWPPMHPAEKGVDHNVAWGMSSEGASALSRVHAIEASTFVLCCHPIISATGIAAHRVEGNPLFGHIGGGDSAVYGPDGRRMTEPIGLDVEGFVFAELNMDELISIRLFADSVGHYSRPDLLWLGADSREKKHVKREGEGGSAGSEAKERIALEEDRGEVSSCGKQEDLR